MSNIVQVKAGWIKRLPDCILGPFQTKQEAENAYKMVDTEKKLDRKDKKEKKIEEIVGKDF